MRQPLREIGGNLGEPVSQFANLSATSRTWRTSREPVNDFAEASTVLRDPLAIYAPDPDHSVGEERQIVVGASTRNRLLVVVFIDEGDDQIRLISARPATPRERRTYEHGS